MSDDNIPYSDRWDNTAAFRITPADLIDLTNYTAMMEVFASFLKTSALRTRKWASIEESTSKLGPMLTNLSKAHAQSPVHTGVIPITETEDIKAIAADSDALNSNRHRFKNMRQVRNYLAVYEEWATILDRSASEESADSLVGDPEQPESPAPTSQDHGATPSITRPHPDLPEEVINDTPGTPLTEREYSQHIDDGGTPSSDTPKRRRGL